MSETAPIISIRLHDPSRPSPTLGTTTGTTVPTCQPAVTSLQPAQAWGVSDAQGRDTFNSERSLGVTPVQEGDVAIGGQSGLPEGHANMGDNIEQNVIGKYTNNSELHERGELRETGGKAATEGRARAAHD